MNKSNLNLEKNNLFQIENKNIDGVPVRIYKPDTIKGNEKIKGVVYIHGGGFISGSLGK